MIKCALWGRLGFFKWRVVQVVDAADEVPKRLPRNGAFLVGSRRRWKWIVFDCPCWTGHRIMLNLDKARWPYWTVTKRGGLTISPSIDYKRWGRRCHFFIRNGVVRWVRKRHEGEIHQREKTEA